MRTVKIGRKDLDQYRWRTRLSGRVSLLFPITLSLSRQTRDATQVEGSKHGMLIRYIQTVLLSPTPTSNRYYFEDKILETE
jgi:hypothetical protein